MALLAEYKRTTKRGSGIQLKSKRSSYKQTSKRSSQSNTSDYSATFLQGRKSTFSIKMFGFLRPSLLNPHFAMAMDNYVSANNEIPWWSSKYRPWRHLKPPTKDLGSSIKNEGDKFQIKLDVQQFTPEEITVKTADGFIVVECQHDEKRDDHGFVTRHFVRRYALPQGAAAETVESTLSSDGMLSITALRKVPDAVKGERNVPIGQTGPIRKQFKDQWN